VNVKTHDEEGREVYLYTSAIAVAFHRLLVSSLLSYVFRLQMVDKAVRAFPVAGSEGPREVVVKAFLHLLLSAKLLSLVSHSHLFKTHTSLLSGLFLMPTEDLVGVYNQQFVVLTELNANHKELKESVAALNGPRSISVQASAVEGSATEASASEESDTGTTDEVLEESVESGVVYRKWIMGMVDHFTSIHVLEQVCGGLPPKAEINFSILGLNRPSLSSDSWDTMVNEIQTLCGDGSLASKASEMPLPHDLADKVTSIIKTKIDGWRKAESVNKTSARHEAMVYDFFKKLLSEGNPKFTGCGHCEAILMATIHRIRNKNDLKFSLELHAAGKFTIAVSKSCCPVCWDIMDILNRQQGSSVVHFQAQGRHPNLYPVDLPAILDEHIKDELLTKFSITLLKNLVSLFEEDARAAQAKHRRSESNVSQPESLALSLASSSMDGSIDSSAHNDQVHLNTMASSHKRVQAWMEPSIGYLPSD